MQNNKPSNKILLWKFLKLSGISGAIFIGGMLLVLFLLTILFQEKIQGIFLENINKGLKTQIQVDKIKLDLIRHFPNASLTFSNTLIFEPETANKKDTLLNAGNIYLQFSLLDIIKKNYTIKKIEVSDAILRAVINKEGKPNYIIWDNNQGGTSADFSISLKQILLTMVSVDFQDLKTNTRMFFDADKVSIKGLFQSQTFDLYAEGALRAREVKLGNNILLNNMPLDIDISLVVNDFKDFVFRKSIIELNKHQFSLQGKIISGNLGVTFDSSISGINLDINQLIEDLPASFKSYTEEYQGKGDLAFDAVIKGTWSSDENPFIEAIYKVTKGQLVHKASGVKLSDISFQGMFDNGNNRDLASSGVKLSSFECNINKGFLKGKASVYNFFKPSIDVEVFSDIDAGDLIRILNLDHISSASGNIKTNLSFKGQMSNQRDFSPSDLGFAKASGSIQVSDLSFNIENNQLDYRDFTGSFLFRDNNLVIEDFSGNLSSSDFALKGTFRNVLPYVFLENEKIFIDAKLESDNLNFDEMLKQESQESDTIYELKFSEQLGFNLEVKVGKLNFKKFQANNISGLASLNSRKFYASNFSFNSMEGKVDASGYIDGSRKSGFLIGCQAHLDQVDIHQLFYQMGNFGQNSIVDDNIYGKITADFDFSAQWSPSLEADWSSLETTADIRVENGALVDYPPMIELSKFLKISDLDHVTFSTLENQIHIKNRKIFIPEMEIKSSALDLVLSGQHTFENNIDYRLRVLLSDILAKENKASRNPQEQYGEIIDDGLGRTTLFLAISGTTDNPVFRYDFHGVRQKLKEDLKKEKQNLRAILREEFSRNSNEANDTINKISEYQKRKEEIKKQEEGEFIIEWE